MSRTESASTADPSTQPAEGVAASLGVDPEAGLSAGEAARRLAEHGPNALRTTAGPSL